MSADSNSWSKPMPHMFRIALITTLIALLSLVARADDEAISQQIRSRIERMHDTRSHALYLRELTLAEAVGQFYEYRNFAPAWTNPAHVDSLLREIENIRGDGLNPQDYHLAALQQQYAQLKNRPADIIALATFDLTASEAYLRALAHLFRGKVNPKTLDAQWNFTLNDMATSAAFPLVNNAVNTGDIAAVFAQARPRHPLYDKTRQALVSLRLLEMAGGWPPISATETLKAGMRSPQVVVVRQRLSAVGYLSADKTDSDVYDDELVAAVRNFQREQFLEDDGAIGPATRAVLNVPIATRIEQARANLERGRWLLHDLPARSVVVDVAGFKVNFLQDGKRIWQANVQVGKPYRSTPIFMSKITYITFNPTWTVPPTIFKNDILPKIRKDKGYLARNNLRVLNANGREIAADSVDWNRPGNILLRADAGPENPLGELVIRFPNPYAVYLHDTSHKELFDSSQRAFSSGCIRVENPKELVELLMNDPEKWNRAAIDAKIAEGKTQNVDLATPVQLLLAYWTVDVLDNGHIVFKPDIYRRDPDLLKALNKRL